MNVYLFFKVGFVNWFGTASTQAHSRTLYFRVACWYWNSVRCLQSWIVDR